MRTTVAKTSRVIKDMTANVRTHFDVFDKARDVFLNQIKKAESDYFDRIRRATAVLAGEAEANEAPAVTPEAGPPPAA